jgi:serine/threonine-protein kinase
VTVGARPSATPSAPAAPATIGTPPATATPEPAAPETAADPGPATPAPTAPAVGWLLVLVQPWADVTIDGRPAGQTPLARVPLPPGAHSVVLTHPQYQPFMRKVTIRPGETVRLRLDFAQEGLRR